MTTPALTTLHEMRDEVVKQKEESGSCTLSYWRFKDPAFWEAMEAFAKGADWSCDASNGSAKEGEEEEACRQEVQTLFTRMNKAMAAQEGELLWPNNSNNNDNNSKSPPPVPNPDQWSVVFGGKWAVQPCSISEQLVEMLRTSAAGANNDNNDGGAARVYTVSRTTTTEDGQQPSDVVHFAKQNLDLDGGAKEFEHVMNRVVDDWQAIHNQETGAQNPIVFYFTLGKHKGKNLPFQRNIQSANNFVQALETIVPTRLIAKGIPWKVVVTGTDATNPSTQPDPTMTVQDVFTTAPTYKMLPHNTVYAASKLCQFYKVAAAVSSMSKTSVTSPLETTRTDNDGSLASISKQLEDFVMDAGNNGVYQVNKFLTDKEVDQISNYWTQVAEPSLKEYIQTAKCISICYTPLHRDPWTAMCLATDDDGKRKESPKKFMIQNVIWRLKNAISIDMAARAHF